MPNKVFTPENISKLKQNEVFVFGSNKAGNHVGGAARVAVAKIGSSGDLAQIDGKSLKEDVFYQLKGGEFVEAAE